MIYRPLRAEHIADDLDCFGRYTISSVDSSAPGRAIAGSIPCTIKGTSTIPPYLWFGIGVNSSSN
jgi:hypothetical protein